MTYMDGFRRVASRISRLTNRGARRQAEIALRLGNRAQAEGDRALAIAAYHMARTLDPTRAGPAIKLANVLKDVGAIEEAVLTYREVITTSGATTTTLINLGHALRQLGRHDEAVDSFASALALDENSREARHMLLIMGAGGQIIKNVPDADIMQSDLFRLDASFQDVSSALRQWNSDSTYPAAAWNAFRRDFPIINAPASRSRRYLVVVNAGAEPPAFLRRTLLSLVDQTDANWTAIVVGMADEPHSVTSFQQTERRIEFVGDLEDFSATMQGREFDAIVSIEAGTVVHESALSWLSWALELTSAAMIYCDHDHVREQWSCGRLFSDPTLYGMADPIFFEGTSRAPVLLAGDAALAHELLLAYTGSGDSNVPDVNHIHRQLVLGRVGKCPVPHIPLPLASRLLMPDAAERIRPSQSIAKRAVAKPQSQLDPAQSPITVVIPTKDEAAMLMECVESLYALSSSPDRLNITVVDNGSERRETQYAMAQLGNKYGVKHRRDDTGFNWSFLNNAACVEIRTGILVFCNNDTVMLSRGWDDELRAGFADPNVGAIGVRLWYPDGQQQHAGIVFGFDNGAPKHEGLFSPRSDGGPNGRWVRRRGVAAVTGAFLAVPAAVFHEVGGFDEVALSIAYNDVDFSMKVRERGYIVVYDPTIQLVHKESKTRGLNNTLEKVAWDEGELFSLRQRWGRAIVEDPFVSPVWSRHVHQPFGGYASLNQRALIEYVKRSNRTRPWLVQRRGSDSLNDEFDDRQF